MLINSDANVIQNGIYGITDIEEIEEYQENESDCVLKICFCMSVFMAIIPIIMLIIDHQII